MSNSLKLAAELQRLYLIAPVPDALARQAVTLATPEGLTRGAVLAFPKLSADREAGHWERLCVVANALQEQLGLPAPAVSISGAGAFGLWLSLQAPTPVAEVQAFLELLCAAYCPEMKLAADAAAAAVALPPCLRAETGKWAAFIHPGMGAAFAEEAGLDMAPPEAGQVGFLERLESIGAAQFAQALAQLQPVPVAMELSSPAPSSAPAQDHTSARASATPEGLLLKDATLEDIIRYLHAMDIEPTFRHLLRK